MPWRREIVKTDLRNLIVGLFFYLITYPQNNHYDQVSISAQKKEEGELSILFHDFELPLKYAQWMDIYEYHLEHPKKSQWQVSLAFRVSKGTVWNAYRFMEGDLGMSTLSMFKP